MVAASFRQVAIYTKFRPELLIIPLEYWGTIILIGVVGSSIDFKPLLCVNHQILY
jgi:hypothetical protein